MFADENFEAAERQFMYADDIIKEKRIDEAMTVLQQINIDYPTFGKAYNHLGWIYETRLSNLQKAEECYKLSIRYMPNYLPAYYNYAVVLSTCKRYTDLENLLQAAQKIQGVNMGTIYNEYALMYEAQGYYEEAIGYYKKYITQLYNDDSIAAAVKSIERCRKKQDIMNF
jgi:tetratricopeptide (TPR) repeat protein